MLAIVSCFSFARPDANVNDEPNALAAYDVAHQRVQQLGLPPFRIAPFFVNRFLTVSRDGRWLLVPHFDRWDRDIFVLDNYR